MHDHDEAPGMPGHVYFRPGHRKTRTFVYRPHRRWRRWVAIALFAVLFVVGGVNVVSYVLDFHRAQQASEALRDAYHAQEELDVGVSGSETEASADSAGSAGTQSGEAVALTGAKYPGYYYGYDSSRFAAVRKQNKDIIGWLTIDGLIDEAVVQRDNEYYLARDYLGRHNVNGAIFLEESCNLSTRPHTLMLYGHNMKTGTMFGGLRNYEDLTYYKNNPFITFDTIYEEGRYVIFCVGTISTRKTSFQYVNFSLLCSDDAEHRAKELKELNLHSIYVSGIDVTADDQLLLLITCMDDSEQRRVIAARRIRPDETEEELMKIVRKTKRE